MSLTSLKKAKVANKIVLLRADFDVPLKCVGKDVYKVEDDFRMRRALPSIRYLVQNKTKIIIVAHLGRPKTRGSEFSLRPVAEHLADMLKLKFMEISESTVRLPDYQIPHVFFINADFRKPHIKKLLESLNSGDVAVLENIRFYPEENENSEKFGRDLAELAQIYVNDAFGSSYDERASITAVAPLMPHYAGIELESEILALSRILKRPKKPVVVMVGGIKFADKIAGFKGLLEVCDTALVGGGLASLFLKAKGYSVGKSLIDDDCFEDVKNLLRNYKEKILLPVDVVVARSAKEPETLRVSAIEQITPGEMVLDIGPETIHQFAAHLKAANTLLWSGPLGMFEEKPFSHGTVALGRLFAARCNGPAFGVAGGGNTLEAVKLTGMGEYIDFLSTGGSAMLEFLGGMKLPGVEALKIKN